MTVLRGALLVDGTGAPPRPADVVIEADRIAAVEAPGTRRPATGDGDVVDLDGLVLAPGFIDCHTHYDAQVLWDPDLTPSSWHGVTTVVMGNCGFGIAPTRPAGRETIARTLENVEGMSVEALFAGIPWTFETFPEYLDAVERAGPKLNVAVMLGHTPLRLYVLGEEAAERDATSAEIEEMRRLVGEALDAGAIGFASSRQPAHAGAWGKPVPSRLATVDELMRLAEPLAERGRGTFAITHGPDFGPVELAELSVKTGRPVTWTALNASPGAFRLLDKAEARGGEVWPQVACRPIVFQVTLAEPAPFARADAFAQVLSVPSAERSRFYRDPAWREQARADVVRQWHYGWDKVFVAETGAHPELADGPSLAELGAQRGVDPLDVLCDVALDDDLSTRFRVVVANDDAASLAGLLRDDRTLLGLSDAGAHASQLCDAVFATYLLEHWVRETGTLSLEKAIWRITGHPAAVFGIPGRGRVAPGYFADLVAFDPAAVGVERMERVWDLPAGADRLIARSHGLHQVWVNGELASDGDGDGRPRAGRLIRDGGTAAGPARAIERTSWRFRGSSASTTTSSSQRTCGRTTCPPPSATAGHGSPGSRGGCASSRATWPSAKTRRDTGQIAGRSAEFCFRSPAGSRRSASPGTKPTTGPCCSTTSCPAATTVAPGWPTWTAITPTRRCASPPSRASAGRRSSSAATVTSRWPASGPTTTG